MRTKMTDIHAFLERSSDHLQELNLYKLTLSDRRVVENILAQTEAADRGDLSYGQRTLLHGQRLLCQALLAIDDERRP
jgi:hypothetical protein